MHVLGGDEAEREASDDTHVTTEATQWMWRRGAMLHVARALRVAADEGADRCKLLHTIALTGETCFLCCSQLQHRGWAGALCYSDWLGLALGGHQEWDQLRNCLWRDALGIVYV